MRGRDALWLPGTDHAGIATQNVVERDAGAAKARTRFDVGREAFVERVWELRARDRCDHPRPAQGDRCSGRLDPRPTSPWTTGLSRAVREVFVRLYEKGLVYRGHYLINWCPRCLTALSNEEAEKRGRRRPSLAPAVSPGRRRGPSPWPPPGPRPCWATPPWPCIPDDPRYRDADRPATCSCRWPTGASRSSPTRRSTRPSAPAP